MSKFRTAIDNTLDQHPLTPKYFPPQAPNNLYFVVGTTEFMEKLTEGEPVENFEKKSLYRCDGAVNRNLDDLRKEYGLQGVDSVHIIPIRLSGRITQDDASIGGVVTHIYRDNIRTIRTTNPED